MNIPEGCLYTKDHEWVKLEKDLARIGITEYAQSSLGDITYVELPAPDTVCVQFKPFAVVESVKAASDVYAPLSGEVVQANESLREHPELVNQRPYEDGWFALIRVKDAAETRNLLSPAAYAAYLKEKSK